MSTDRSQLGLKVMEDIFGAEITENLMTSFRASAGAREDDWETEVRAFAFGTVYSREGLDLKERALVTIGVVTALGHLDILEAWLKATRNLGLPYRAVRETIIQTAVYGGFPNSRRALGVAQRVLGEDAT